MAARAAPAERILSLAAYAHRSHGPITLDDIADNVPGYGSEPPRAGPLEPPSAEWERVRKLVGRDVSDLREHWGIDLAYDDAEHTYELREPFFTPEERAALVAAAAVVAVVGVDVPVPGALGSAVGDDATVIVLRVHDLVSALRAAIGTRTAVTFVHDGRTRHVQPYALGVWRNRWYLAGRDDGEGALRRFRLDRIERGNGTDAIVAVGPPGAYEIPPDFDAEAAFDLDPNAWGTDPLLTARVEVATDRVDGFLGELGGHAVGQTGDRSVVELDVRHYESFRNRLLAFGTHAVVVAPPVLVAVVRDHLAALAERA